MMNMKKRMIVVGIAAMLQSGFLLEKEGYAMIKEEEMDMNNETAHDVHWAIRTNGIEKESINDLIVRLNLRQDQIEDYDQNISLGQLIHELTSSINSNEILQCSETVRRNYSNFLEILDKKQNELNSGSALFFKRVANLMLREMFD